MLKGKELKNSCDGRNIFLDEPLKKVHIGSTQTEEKKMKKTLLIAAAALISASAFAVSNTVTSANIVGYTKVELAPGSGYKMLTCNFKTADTNTLLSVFGTDMLTQNANYLNCDRVYLYDSGTQTYQAWAQYSDGVFYKANTATEWNAGISGNPEIPVGTGFFLSPGNASNTLIFAGDVVMDATNPVEIVEGYQILGFPYSAGEAIQDTTLFTDGAAAAANYLSCDRIFTYADGVYQAYAIYTDGVWYKANDATEWNQGVAATADIDLSKGFFYNAQTAMTWNQTNIYPNASN